MVCIFNDADGSFCVPCLFFRRRVELNSQKIQNLMINLLAIGTLQQGIMNYNEKLISICADSAVFLSMMNQANKSDVRKIFGYCKGMGRFQMCQTQ